MFARLLATVVLLMVPAGFISTVGVDQAYAAPEWLVKGAPVASNVAVKAKSVGDLTLEDTKVLGVVSAVECKITGEGTVGPGGKDKISTLTTSECKIVKGPCTSILKAVAVHLPWNTQLEEVEGKIRDKVSSGGSGAPGWEVECNSALGKVTDTCTVENSTAVENVTEGVKLTWDSKSAHGSCTIGGAGAGVVKGTLLAEDTEGLSVKSTPSPPATSCPIASEGVTFDATVTSGNKEELREKVINSTWTPVETSIKKCTEVVSYSTGLSKGEITAGQAEEYKTAIAGEVQPGDEIYKLKWHISGGATFETLGVASSSDTLIFEPIEVWDSGSSSESTPGPVEVAKEAGPTWTWGPLTVTQLSALGTVGYESKVSLEIQTNPAKEIVNKTVLIGFTTGLGWNAAATKEEMLIVNGAGVHCLKVIATVTFVTGFKSLKVTAGVNGWSLSVEVTGFLGANGQHQESDELCADGSFKRTVV
ncbi:MAG TPA: hypothetical protein VGI26_09095 [Solirubrobacteraceae bacterium]|jgi:hypothetical protein